MPSLRIGIDVGGTNTDVVLLDTDAAKTPDASILSWHKSITTPDITSGIQAGAASLLASVSVKKDDIICATVGTTHLINALVERDAEKLNRVGLIRLASEGFTQTTPPFIEFPADLRDLIYGGHAIVDGGLQIDGTEIGCINKQQILHICESFRRNDIRNVVVCGVYSPIDLTSNQERRCKEIVLNSVPNVDVFCSSDVGGIGILERENAAVLNATIHEYASFVFGEIENALRICGLQGCPIFISSNDGSMVPVEEATRFPIRSVASGPANSMLGASYLRLQQSSANCQAKSEPPESIEKIMVLDVGGTTTDAGVLMASGIPRQASAYSAIAGAQVNFSMPDVLSIGLGGGSVVKLDMEGIATSIGPESVGNELTTKALCFGGNMLTLTDISVAAEEAPGIGTASVSLEPKTISSAQKLIRTEVEEIIANAKTKATSLPVAFVGGGASILPRSVYANIDILDSTLASVANAVGAATAKLSATTDTIVDISTLGSKEQKKLVQSAEKVATDRCVGFGAVRDSVQLVERQVLEMPYISGKLRVVVKVAGHFEKSSVAAIASSIREPSVRKTSKEALPYNASNGPQIIYEFQSSMDEKLVLGSNFASYYPKISDGTWRLSEVDIEWLSIGCYILGCGGGGSPHLSSIAAKQLLRQGESLSIVDAHNLPPTALLPPVGLLGSPMVSIERPGGNLGADALTNMLAQQGLTNFDASLCVEIGGSNGLSPLLSGGPNREDRPMVDGDLMGRAFPTFEMITPYLDSLDINHLLPASLASGTGTNMTLQTVQNTAATDSMLRACCVTMGCAAGVVSRPLSAKEFVDQGILYTHSLAWRIGRAIKSFQHGYWTGAGTPAEAVVGQCGGKGSAAILFDGKIIDVSNRLVNGHSVGQLIIEGWRQSTIDDNLLRDNEVESKSESRRHLSISFKNENLIAELVDRSSESREVLATVPDLITVLDSRTGLAIGVPEYRYGLRVSVLAIAASPKWTSPRGLAVAGPAHFGLDTEFCPVGIYSPPRSVIEEFGS